MLHPSFVPYAEHREVRSVLDEARLEQDTTHVLACLKSGQSLEMVFDDRERVLFERMWRKDAPSDVAGLGTMVRDIVRLRQGSVLPRTPIDRIVEREIAQLVVREDEARSWLPPVTEVSSWYQRPDILQNSSSVLRRKVADTVMACLMFAQAIVPQWLAGRRSEALPEVVDFTPAIIQTIEQTTSLASVHTAALRIPADSVVTGVEVGTGDNVFVQSNVRIPGGMDESQRNISGQWSDFCKNQKNSVTWSCEAEKPASSVVSATSPQGDYSHKHVTMAGVDKKGVPEKVVAPKKRPANDSCEWYERDKDLICRDTHAKAAEVAERASGWKNTPLHRPKDTSVPLPDHSVTAPAPGLTPFGQHMVSAGKDVGRTMNAAVAAQQMAAERGVNDHSISPTGLFGSSSLSQTEFNLGNISVHTGGEYNSRLGIIGHIDATAMITDDMAITVGGSLGARQKEWLVQAGFEPIDGLSFQGTFRQLRQKLDFDFVSGKTTAEVMETTMGMSVRWKPNIKEAKWLDHVEAKVYRSKAPSVNLASKTFVIETASLYQLWRDPRRIAGSTTDGGEFAMNIRLGDHDTILVSAGLERFERLTQESTGAKMRPTGSAGWEHQFDRDAAIVPGMKTNLGLSSQSGMPLGLQGKVTQPLGEDWHIQWTVTQGLLSEGDGVGGMDAGRATSIMASVTYKTPAPKPIPEYKHHDVRTPRDSADVTDPVLPTEAAREPSQPDSARAAQERRQRIMERSRARPSYNPSSVRASVDETARPILEVNVDKTSLPAGSSVDALGNAHLEASVVLGALVSAINSSTGENITSLFTVSGTQLNVNLNALEPKILGSSAAAPHTITVTTATSVITITAYHGSVHITRVTAVESWSVNDVTPPLTTASPSVSSTTSSGTTLSAKISEAGTGYYLVQAAAAAAPTAAAVKAANNSFAMTANTTASVNITGLSASTAYKVYFVAQDTRANLQTSVGSVSLTTAVEADVTAPDKTGESETNEGTAPSTSNTDFSLDFDFNEAVTSVTNLTMGNGASNLDYQLLNGGMRVRVTGTTGSAGDVNVSFTVKDAANNARAILSNPYSVFDPE